MPGPAEPIATPSAGRPPWFVPLVILSSLSLVRLPVLASNSIAAYGAVLLVLGAAAGLVVLGPRVVRWNTGAMLTVAFIALSGIAVLRGVYYDVASASSGAIQIALMLGIATIAAGVYLRDQPPAASKRYVEALVWAPAFYVATNLALYLGGVLPPNEVTSDAGTPATVLGLVGINVNRVVFPLSGGLNGVGPIAAAAFVVGAVLFVRGHRRVVAALTGLSGLYMMLAIDSRGAVLFAVLATLIVLGIPRLAARDIGWAAILLPVLPIVLIIALSGLANTQIGASLDRSGGGGESLSTGTGRTDVWDVVVDKLTEPRLETIVGYGQNGQVVSKVGEKYAYLFRGDTDPASKSAHNILLQNGLDSGLIGMALFVALSASLLGALGRRIAEPPMAALLAIGLTIILIGLVQADPVPFHLDTFSLWLLLAFAAAGSALRPGARA